MGVFKKTFCISSLFLVVGVSFAHNEIRWRDPETKAQYLVLSGNYSWTEARRACRKRGWDLFNYAYLSDAEQKRILDSPVLRGLVFERKSSGGPAERREASVWLSSEASAIVSGENSVSALVATFREFSNENRARVLLEWASKYSQ